MKKQLIYALNSLELSILIFTKVSWGHYAKDPHKFLLKLADVASSNLSDTECEIIGGGGFEVFHPFMMKVWGVRKNDEDEFTIPVADVVKTIASGSDHRGLSQQVSQLRHHIKVVIGAKLSKSIKGFCFPKEQWYTRTKGEHRVIELVEAFSSPIQSFGSDLWHSTLVGILFKGGISDLRSIKFPGASDDEAKAKLLEGVINNPRLVAYIVAFLLSVLRTACTSTWSWRKQGIFSGHMVCHADTLKDLEEAAELVAADMEWFEEQDSESLLDPVYAHLLDGSSSNVMEVAENVEGEAAASASMVTPAAKPRKFFKGEDTP